MSGHANQNLVLMRKNFLLSGVSSEYKDLVKFAEDTDSHLFGEETEDSLKEDIMVCRRSSLKSPRMLQLSENSIKP